MSHPELRLDNQVCFLFHRIDQVIQAKYRPILAGLGLTYPQYLAMLVLWETSSRPIPVSELCSRLASDTGTISPLLKRLEKAGLVHRQRDQADERSVLVSLSPAGLALETEARSVPGQILTCLTQAQGSDITQTRDWHRDLSDLLTGLN